MKRCSALLAVCFILLNLSAAHADLASYLWELNASARGNAAAYQKEIQQRFAVSAAEYGAIRQAVDAPGEVVVVLWLSERANAPADTVLQTRRALPGGEWEAVALELGLSPASEDFEALHYGELGWSPVGAARYGSLVEYADFHARLE